MPLQISRRTLLRLAAAAGALPLGKAQEMVNSQRPVVSLV